MQRSFKLFYFLEPWKVHTYHNSLVSSVNWTFLKVWQCFQYFTSIKFTHKAFCSVFKHVQFSLLNCFNISRFLIRNLCVILCIIMLWGGGAFMSFFSPFISCFLVFLNLEHVLCEALWATFIQKVLYKQSLKPSWLLENKIILKNT